MNREQQLTAQINQLVDQLKELPRGDPRHIPIVAQLNKKRRELKKIQEKEK